MIKKKGRYIIKQISKPTFKTANDGSITYQISAIPYEGYAFDYWKIESESIDSNPYNLTITSDTTISAVFKTNNEIEAGDH